MSTMPHCRSIVETLSAELKGAYNWVYCKSSSFFAQEKTVRQERTYPRHKEVVTVILFPLTLIHLRPSWKCVQGLLQTFEVRTFIKLHFFVERLTKCCFKGTAASTLSTANEILREHAATNQLCHVVPLFAPLP